MLPGDSTHAGHGNPSVYGSESRSENWSEQALIRVFWPIRCLETPQPVSAAAIDVVVYP